MLPIYATNSALAASIKPSINATHATTYKATCLAELPVPPPAYPHTDTPLILLSVSNVQIYVWHALIWLITALNAKVQAVVLHSFSIVLQPSTTHVYRDAVVPFSGIQPPASAIPAMLIAHAVSPMPIYVQVA
jgi:hypothetical protein